MSMCTNFRTRRLAVARVLTTPAIYGHISVMTVNRRLRSRCEQPIPEKKKNKQRKASGVQCVHGRDRKQSKRRQRDCNLSMAPSQSDILAKIRQDYRARRKTEKQSCQNTAATEPQKIPTPPGEVRYQPRPATSAYHPRPRRCTVLLHRREEGIPIRVYADQRPLTPGRDIPGVSQDPRHLPPSRAEVVELECIPWYGRPRDMATILTTVTSAVTATKPPPERQESKRAAMECRRQQMRKGVPNRHARGDGGLFQVDKRRRKRGRRRRQPPPSSIEAPVCSEGVRGAS